LIKSNAGLIKSIIGVRLLEIGFKKALNEQKHTKIGVFSLELVLYLPFDVLFELGFVLKGFVYDFVNAA
jgi:hypothetical protein